MSYIDDLIEERLGGDDNRVAELFYDDSVFKELVAKGRNSDWYHFQPKTYDGEYLVKTSTGYACYSQERGVKSNSMLFSDLHAAAVFFYTQAGYIKSEKKRTEMDLGGSDGSSAS